MRIAFVDPSPAVQSLAAHSLDARGHEVLCFADGANALQGIRADPLIDALITDDGRITESGTRPLSGVELCWEARLLAGKKRPLYILLVAASEDNRTWTEALDCGADDVISKPPANEELFAKLRVADRVVTLQRELIQMATRDALTGVQQACLLRGSDRGLRRGRSGLSAERPADRYRSVQGNQRPLWARCRRPGAAGCRPRGDARRSDRGTLGRR
jgi:DNA-binding response OmpR family regulator